MKKTIIRIGLGAAFVAVSAWVALSGGRSARAVRTKFRLGGAILTITSALTAASCEIGSGGFITSCYDPVMPPRNMVYADTKIGTELRNGDIVPITIYSEFASEGHISLESREGKELQSLTVTLPGDGEYDTVEFTIAVGDYRGEAKLKFSCQEWADDKENIQSGSIDIVIVD